MLLTRQQILRVVLNRTPRARNGSDSAIAIVIKIFIRRESAGKIGGKPIRTKTRLRWVRRSIGREVLQQIRRDGDLFI